MVCPVDNNKLITYLYRMKIKKEKALLIVVIVAVILLGGLLIANIIAKNKIEKKINNLSNNIKVEYESINLNIITGNAKLIKPLITIYGKTTGDTNALVKLTDIELDNFSFWNYFFDDLIHIEAIVINNPNVTYFHNNLVKSEDYKNTFKSYLKNNIEVGVLKVLNGETKVYNISNDSLLFKTGAVNFKMNDITVKKSEINSKPSFYYQDFQLSTNNLFYSLGDFENLYLNHLEFTKTFTKLIGMSLKTKYPKQELERHIETERDHYDLKIDSISINGQDFGYKNDTLFYFKSKEVDLYQPDFEIYRNKLLPDDLSYKALYSKSLRNLRFAIGLDKVNIHNTDLKYTEKVKQETKGGSLKFRELNAEINNLGNEYVDSNQKLKAHINAIFMDDAPIAIDWEFDVNNPNDEFMFKAEIGELKANNLNPFMEPNENLRLNGVLNKTYFTISGDENISKVDLKLQYDDFKVSALKENGNEKKPLLTGLINMFLKNDSKDRPDDFRYGSKDGIERNKTKSIFNLLWLNIKSGLMNAMAGNGKKG